MVAPVADNILAIVPNDNQRGCPNFEKRLLLLNTVESNPHLRANPEQEYPRISANFSTAIHTSE